MWFAALTASIACLRDYDAKTSPPSLPSSTKLFLALALTTTTVGPTQEAAVNAMPKKEVCNRWLSYLLVCARSARSKPTARA